MNAGSQLLQLYREWRLLTEAESQAITEGDLPKLSKLQTQKHSLQGPIEQAERAAMSANELSSPESALAIRSTLNTLMELEKKNVALLEHRRQDLEQERQQLYRSRRNLRQVHQAYAASKGSLWQSYS